jgi:hypothetical protein
MPRNTFHQTADLYACVPVERGSDQDRQIAAARVFLGVAVI